MHLTFFNNKRTFNQRQVILKNMIVNVPTNQYQYKMKNESCQRLVHFKKLLFLKYTITNDQTPIKYFKGELKHVLQKGIDSHKTSAYSL